MTSTSSSVPMRRTGSKSTSKSQTSPKRSTSKKNGLMTVLHPNRYFIYAIIFSFVAGGMLLAYINLSNINEQNQSAFVPLTPQTKKYINSDIGFELEYPLMWQIELGTGPQSIVFENPQNLSQAVTVTKFPIQAQTMLVKSLHSTSEADTTIDGNTIQEFTGNSTITAIVTNGSNLFYFDGLTPSTMSFLNSFHTISQ